ncbi:DnaJ domain-containing protein [Chloroflexota bacterium]
MKDYYRILGVPENSPEADIKKAFRKLAFRCHPDKNPGNEKQAEENFKEINEAYGVLRDKNKRQQYDLARKGPFASIGQDAMYQGFGYSQQDIFNGIFSNRAMFDEMNRMFAQAGLRFDRDFLNRVFYSGRGFTFQFFTGPGSEVYGNHGAHQPYSNAPTYKPSWMEKMLARIATRTARFLLKKLFNVQQGALPGHDLDHHVNLEITPTEATSGGEKRVTYQRGGLVKNLMVKVPSGVKTGNRIRLKGMGMTVGNKSGDLYLHVQVKDRLSTG